MGAMPGVKGIWTNKTNAEGDKKAPEVNMTGWESVVTGHVGSNEARTWFWGRKRAGRWKFRTGDQTEVKV
jgi:U3 small nucleolar RNA-associated protein 21